MSRETALQALIEKLVKRADWAASDKCPGDFYPQDAFSECADELSALLLREGQAFGGAIEDARRYLALPTVDSDSKRIIAALLAGLMERQEPPPARSSLHDGQVIEPKRLFPIQRERGAKAHRLLIPWSVAEKAYSVYSAKYGTSQSLQRLAERGGFGPSEMDMFHPAWREESDEVFALKAELATLKAVSLPLSAGEPQ